MAAKAGKKYGPTHRENAGVPPVEAESLILVVMRYTESSLSMMLRSSSIGTLAVPKGR